MHIYIKIKPWDKTQGFEFCLLKLAFFVEYSCVYYRADNADGNHDSNCACVERGNKHEKQEHDNDRRDRELEVL